MRTAFLFGAIFLLALVPVSAGDQLVSRSPSPTQADLDWVEQRLGAARDRLMPLRGREDRQFVAYRTSRDQFMATAESHFAITFPQGSESLEAVVTTLVGGSIRNQLLKLHVADRDASLDTLLFQVNAPRAKFDAGCPTLKIQADALLIVPIDLLPVKRNFIPMHPTVHRIVLDLNGTHLDAGFDGPEKPLVRWALDTLEALNKCTAA